MMIKKMAVVMMIDHDHDDHDSIHLQLLIFSLNGFIGVDPRNDCLQPLLLLPLSHMRVHISDKRLHAPEKNHLVIYSALLATGKI